MQTILSAKLFVLLRQVTLLFSIGLYFLIRQISVLAASVAWLHWSFVGDNSCWGCLYLTSTFISACWLTEEKCTTKLSLLSPLQLRNTSDPSSCVLLVIALPHLKVNTVLWRVCADVNKHFGLRVYFSRRLFCGYIIFKPFADFPLQSIIDYTFRCAGMDTSQVTLAVRGETSPGTLAYWDGATLAVLQNFQMIASSNCFDQFQARWLQLLVAVKHWEAGGIKKLSF